MKKWHSAASASAALCLTCLTLLSALLTVAPSPARAAGISWYKADLHVHSAYSADARPDLGIISHNAAAAGYNAIFLTDHNLGSSFPISSLTANHLVLEDTYTRWTAAKSGSLTSSANAFVGSPIHSGTASLHLAASSASAGQAFVWSTRGPNFSSGDAIVRFSAYPVRIDAGSSLYVSASIGGDPAVRSPVGYTTAAGAVSPGKSSVFVWYWGSPPPAALFPASTVRSFALNGNPGCDRGFTTGSWINCTIDLNAALAGLTAADLPDAHDAWTDLKLAAAAGAGSVDGYFDGYSIDASAPVSAGNEFVTRNQSLSLTGMGTWDTSTFRLFPSLELGISKHSQRFDFGISDPSQNLWYQNGTDGIADTQASGYPAQLNHPGVPGGVTQQEAIDSAGEGADLIEVRQPVMIGTWDGILKQGVPIVGTWGTDNHNASWGSGSQATVIAAPNMSFDALMRSLYEGTIYLSNVGFSGRVLFNLDCGASPYPARYPVFVSDQAASASACLTVTGGIGSGSSVVWISGGTTLGTSPASGSYAATRTIPLTGASTYVRAEVRNSAGTQTAMSQALLFDKVVGLPPGMSFHADGVTTPSGHDYTRTAVRGITASTWDGTAAKLTLSLANPAGSLVEFEVSTAGAVPESVVAGGTTVPAAGSLTEFLAATGPIWFYDAVSGILHVKASQATASTQTVIGFGPSGGPSASHTATPTAAPFGATSTFRPTADAYVSSDQPTTNFGTLTALRVDGSPTVRSYLRFSLTGLTGTVTQATLRVYANTAQSLGYDAWSVADSTWGETSITYANAPPPAGARTGSSGPVAAGTWKQIDVKPLIGGNGTYSMALSTSSATALSLASRESANPPQLVVTTSGAVASPTPSASRTPGATPSPSSPAASATPTPTGSTLTFRPVADAYVNGTYPTTNYGTLTTLRVDGSPAVRSYLRFSLSGLSGTVVKATLRIYANSTQSVGFDVWSVSSTTWAETAITYSNAPPVAVTRTGSSGPVAAGTWLSVDVTALITGNGTYSLALSTSSATALSLASRESANSPQLLVTSQ